MVITFASFADEGNVLIAVYLFVYMYVCMYVCMYICVSNNSKSTGPNFMKFGGMIDHDLRTNRLDFGRALVKGQGQGHKKVKNDGLWKL